MAYQTVIIEKRRHIGILTLNRPQARNTLNEQLFQDIVAALQELENDGEVRVIIVKGNGPAFCAGRDISEPIPTPLERHQSGGFVSLAETLATIHKPVIAAVHGAAVAGGCGLAMACDLAVAVASKAAVAIA